MLLTLLSLLLAGPAPAIFVGPMVRDGFVDTDTGVRDSVSDLRVALKKKGLRITEKEADATLRLYVLGRGSRAGGGGVSTGTVIGPTVVGTTVPGTIRTLETLLRAGDYERPFVAERNDSSDWNGSWKGCASQVAKDVAEWVSSNRERIASAQ